MTVKRVLVPYRLTTDAALRFGQALRELEEAAEYDIDFAACRWVEPFSALIASSEITRFKHRVRQSRIRFSNFTHMDYAAHIGFFRSFGISYGNSSSEVAGGATYLPIFLLSSEQVRESASVQGIAVGAVMEQHADRLAHVLCQSSSGNVYDSLSYSIREILRNVVEHSGADRLAFCAQYWPRTQQVEVAVMDWGRGIRKGLSENPKIKLESDSDALHLALLPGISGKAEKVKKLRFKDYWTNSGYGLYMTSRLCRLGGSFLIGSGDAGLLISGDEVLAMKWDLGGTSIRLRIDIARLPSLHASLERFRNEAHEFRKGTGASDFLTASMASRSLSKNFSCSELKA